MANKCNNCGKFFATADGVKCFKCSSTVHRICAWNKNASNTSAPAKYMCKSCKDTSPVSSEVTTKNKTLTYTHKNMEDSPEKFLDAGDGALDLAEQIRLLRSELMSVSQVMTSFKTEIARLNSTVSEFNERLWSIESRVSSLEEKTQNTQIDTSVTEIVAQLQTKMEEKEQSELLNDVELTGISERNGDNISHIVCLVAKKLDVSIEPRDIVFAERTGPRRAHSETGGSGNTRPRAIVVRLARRALRNDLLRAARVRRGADSSGIVEGEPKRFYINERLTRNNRQLFYKAREIGRKLNWRYVWTRGGRIFVRRDSSSTISNIRSDKDLEMVFGRCTI